MTTNYKPVLALLARAGDLANSSRAGDGAEPVLPFHNLVTDNAALEGLEQCRREASGDRLQGFDRVAVV